jgi:hypothetical protein
MESKKPESEAIVEGVLDLKETKNYELRVTQMRNWVVAGTSKKITKNTAHYAEKDRNKTAC